MRAYWSKLARALYRSATSSPAPDAKVLLGVRAAAIVLRTIFICTMIVITIIVSLPQNETILTVYDTPLDVVRLLLGLGVCIWLVVQLFKGPRDADGYRTWIYLGVVAVPFAWICLVYVWSGD
jgi:FtsH-binding integral membrane protein